MDLRDYADALKSKRVIHLIGRVDEKMLEKFRVDRAKLFDGASPAEVIVTLTTGGGDVAWGWAIFDELKVLAHMTSLRLLCVGMIYSMGVAIAMALPLDRRFASEHASFYMHKSQLTYGERREGVEEDHENEYREYGARIDFFKQNSEMIVAGISQGTNLSLDDVRTLFKQPRYLSASEAVEKRLVSGVVV
jgi:ATP-dependent protease ClpP protease subunit